MDPTDFDALTRSLGRLGSRRAALAAVVGGLGLLGGHAVNDAAAHDLRKTCKKKSGKQKKKCLKKAKKHNAAHSTTTALICTPDCTNKECGDNGCGGVCGQCATGRTCCNHLCVNTQSTLEHCGACNTPCPVPACQRCQSGTCVNANQGQTCATSASSGAAVRCCDGACPDPPCTPSGLTGQSCGGSSLDCVDLGVSCCSGKFVECTNLGTHRECFCPPPAPGEPCGSDRDCVACICNTCREPV